MKSMDGKQSKTATKRITKTCKSCNKQVYILTRDGKEPSLLGFGSVRVLGLPRFGSVRVLFKYLKTGFGFCDYQGSVRFGSKISVLYTAKLHTPQKKTFVLLCQNRIMF